MKNTLRPILPALVLLLLFSGIFACSGPEEQNHSTNTDIDIDAGSEVDVDRSPDSDEATCQDGVLNGLETDVDCGGLDCEACEIGAICDDNTDCKSELCSLDGICLPAPTCDDGILNNYESDIDCGGPNCPSCPDGDRCNVDTDCESDYCSVQGLCVSPTCEDGVQNGTETGVDCGGPECTTCQLGESCQDNSDCESSSCDDNICVPLVLWSTVSASSSGYTCATRTDGTLWCWGNNTEGQLGIDSTTDSLTPVRVGTDYNWSGVSAGDRHTCAIRSDGSIWCWGHRFAALGLGPNNDIPAGSTHIPSRVGSDNNWNSISAGQEHTCATDNSDDLWCWGDNYYGEVQSQSQQAHSIPYRVGNLGHASVDMKSYHSCGINNNNTLSCWGANWSGQLGNGESVDDGEFHSNSGSWGTVSAGVNNTCAIGSNGTIWCWGSAYYGITGRLSWSFDTTPAQLDDSTQWSKISVNFHHVCAIRSDESLWCWGRNEENEASPTVFDTISSPLKYGSDTWETVSVGDRYTCAIDTDGGLWCWGLNDKGQLGDGTTTDRSEAVLVTVP